MASPLSSSTGALGWSRIAAARWITVSTPRKRLASDPRIGEVGQVAEREADLHPQPAQPPRIADQDADLLAALEQQRQERPAHRPRGAGHQDHRRETLECFRSPARAPPVPEPPTTRQRRDRRDLAYVIAEPCIGQKDNSCVEVCPVDCIHPTPDEPDYENVEQLYIDPDECIDCDACVEACPVDACFAEDQLPEEWAKYTQINAEYFAGNGK